MEITRFRKVLCANRGEIAIRVFRACTELDIKTVAIFSEEDRTHQHRYKADEAYLVGRGKKPVEAYLGIEEILEVAHKARVEAIHPGYGFLSENADFAQACESQGIRFIGPRPEVVRLMGDKVLAKELAIKAGVPVVPGCTIDIGRAGDLEHAREFAKKHATVLVKAAHGGGGRGMRVVRDPAQLDEAIASASSESKSAFGSPVVFLEKFLERVRHVEVQVLGDAYGNLVHLYERDCSVQRRHQKIIEIAPAYNLADSVRKRILDDALKIARACGYSNAGTVEFLTTGKEHWFIEVNPRLQVEHTVTEVVTGIDLVQSQIRVAEGHSLASEEIGIFSQQAIQTRGYAIQCRVTTEDPANNFMPDTGTIRAFRSGHGFGIRTDTGNGYSGAYISPYYDSLLVKVTAFAPTFHGAAKKGLRALREFRVRGVKTNLPFLENVLQHETFLIGETWTRFIDESPELFRLMPRRDRATKLLAYLGNVVVNGHPTVKKEQKLKPTALLEAPVPALGTSLPPPGTSQILQERGAEGLAKWVMEHNKVLLTDTTFRDAHQSLLATRVRTRDILRIAPATALLADELFSLESWGGATFDVAYRFLDECPWDRLRRLKKAVPNILHQMLLRGANAVGYTSYPNNVVEAFIDEAAEQGVDVFRVFDSLNDLSSMKVSVGRIRKTGKVCEIAMCYTGDVANEKRKKFDLGYYIELAKRIEGLGAHFLCIKDMAGLLRPRAAELLISKLRETVKLPIHLHTHDTSGNGIATLMEAVRCGVHIVDVALAPMAGMTSQPSMNALVAALRGNPRESGLTNKRLQPLCDYWEVVRDYYAPFEAGLKSCTSEVYYHEIPGGQYSNLRPQVAELGLIKRWNDVKDAFAVVNQLCGDIPKVTPSSKMVGDFAIFLVQNDLLVKKPDLEVMTRATHEKLLAEAARLNFPESVVTYFQGHLGHPPGGFPEPLRTTILKGLPIVEGNPSDRLAPLDLDGLTRKLEDKHGRKMRSHDVISAALYPRVLDEYFTKLNAHEDVSILDTPVYFYGMEIGQEIWVELEQGKTLVVSLQAIGDADANGMRTVWFELNGQARQVSVRDKSRATTVATRRKADKGDANQVGAAMPGTVIAVHCKEGEAVREGTPLLTIEAMKMETVLRATKVGRVKQVIAGVKSAVQAEDLLVLLD